MTKQVYVVYPLEAAMNGYENYSSIKEFDNKFKAIEFASKRKNCCIYKFFINRNVLQEADLILEYE